MQKFVFKEVKNQIIATACANLMAVAHGGLMGWYSPARLVLEKEGSPIGELSVEASSWLSSCSYLGGFIGTFVFMWVTKKLGRKNTFLILAIPNFIFWLAIVLSKQLLWLIMARVMGGFVGGGMYISVPLLVTEIADDHVRGRLASMLMIFANVGVMASYLTGSYMNYTSAPYVMMMFPIGVFVSFIFIPDTPMSLINRKKSNDAVEKSLKFYLNISEKSTSEEDKERFEKSLAGVRALVEKKKNAPRFTPRDLIERKALIGFGKSFSMVFLSIFCGTPVLQNYSSKVFEESGSKLDAKLCAVIMIIIQVMATIIASLVVDKLGRRILLIGSSIGATVGLIIMGTFTYCASHEYDVQPLSWVPVAAISFFVFSAYIGLLPLVFVIIMEVLPSKVREFYATVCLSLVSLFMFVIVKLYPIVSGAISMWPCMWFFAVVAFLAALFGVFILEETKGKDLTES